MCTWSPNAACRFLDPLCHSLDWLDESASMSISSELGFQGPFVIFLEGASARLCSTETKNNGPVEEAVWYDSHLC